MASATMLYAEPLTTEELPVAGRRSTAAFQLRTLHFGPVVPQALPPLLPQSTAPVTLMTACKKASPATLHITHGTAHTCRRVGVIVVLLSDVPPSSLFTFHRNLFGRVGCARVLCVRRQGCTPSSEKDGGVPDAPRPADPPRDATVQTGPELMVSASGRPQDLALIDRLQRELEDAAGRARRGDDAVKRLQAAAAADQQALASSQHRAALLDDEVQAYKQRLAARDRDDTVDALQDELRAFRARNVVLERTQTDLAARADALAAENEQLRDELANKQAELAAAEAAAAAAAEAAARAAARPRTPSPPPPALREQIYDDDDDDDPPPVDQQLVEQLERETRRRADLEVCAVTRLQGNMCVTGV